MKLKNYLLIACTVVSVSLFAEENAEAVPNDWKWSGVVGLNASATGMVNWSAGGANNVSGVAFGKVRLLYDKNNLSWETNLDVEYGLTYLDQKYDKLQKSSDHLIFNTKFGWAFQPKWYLTASAAFQTQFALGKTYTGDDTPNPIVSNILAPSYTDLSVGIDWKPNDIFSVYLSPVAGRITTAYISDRVNNKYKEQYPLEDGGLRQALQEKNGTWHYTSEGDNGYAKKYGNVRAELGLTLKGGINWSYKDLKIITTVSLFTPYAWDKTKLYNMQIGGEEWIYSEQQMIDKFGSVEQGDYLGYRDNNRRFGNFDVDWDVAISYQFLKCLNVTLSTSLKYYNGVKIADKDGNAAERVQFKSILGLGVGYSF